MKGRIVSRPLPVELHSCPTPTFISRWLRRLKEGTVWKCDDCRSQYRLLFRYAMGDGVWVWEKLSPAEQAEFARQQLDNPVFKVLFTKPDSPVDGPVEMPIPSLPNDPGPIRTSPDDALEQKFEAAQKALRIIGATRGVESDWVKVVDAVDEFQQTLKAIGTLRARKRRTP